MKEVKVLIQKLLDHPETSHEDEIVADLVMRYSESHDLQSLANLLRSEDTVVRRVAALVSVNLGEEVCLLVDDLMRLQDCDDDETRRSAVKVVYRCTDVPLGNLIDIILRNPAKAANDGIPNILIDEYERGRELETLKPLLLSQDDDVQSIASFILSELGGTAWEFIDEIDSLLTSPHPIVRGDSFDFVWQCSFEHEEFREYFAIVTNAMSDAHVGNRLRAMELVQRATDHQLQAAIIHYEKTGVGRSHQIGLKVLLKQDVTPESTLLELVGGSDPLLRKYAMIGLVKRAKHLANMPDLQLVDDVDVMEFISQAFPLAVSH